MLSACIRGDAYKICEQHTKSNERERESKEKTVFLCIQWIGMCVLRIIMHPN